MYSKIMFKFDEVNYWAVSSLIILLNYKVYILNYKTKCYCKISWLRAKQQCLEKYVTLTKCWFTVRNFYIYFNGSYDKYMFEND